MLSVDLGLIVLRFTFCKLLAMTLLRDCLDPQFAPTAVRVALGVGSAPIHINHGAAALQGRMSRDDLRSVEDHRWLATLLTYRVPYRVIIHGQASTARRLHNTTTPSS